MTGKVGDSFTLPTFGRIKAANVMLVGLGPKDEAGQNEIRRAALKVGRRAAQSGVVATTLHRVGRSGEESARALAEGLTLGAYRFDRYKERPIDEEAKERPGAEAGRSRWGAATRRRSSGDCGVGRSTASRRTSRATW